MSTARHTHTAVEREVVTIVTDTEISGVQLDLTIDEALGLVAFLGTTNAIGRFNAVQAAQHWDCDPLLAHQPVSNIYNTLSRLMNGYRL